MKKIIITVMIFFAVPVKMQAQNSVGIGIVSPNIPHPSAALHISSTTKGIRLPSMPGTNVNFITGAPDGLLLFNTTSNLPMHFNGTSWRYLLTSDFWKRPIANRSIISNTTDSIGIFTNVPTRRLNVNGNILARDGIITQGLLQSAGDFILTGTSNFGQNLTGFNNVIINNTAGILNFETSSTGKGFIQLSGNDLRFGNYSGNTAGNIVLRTAGVNQMTVYENGNVGIGTTAAPTSLLRVNGNIYSNTELKGYTLNVSSFHSSKVLNGTTGADHNLLPLCYGKIGSGGNLLNGTDNISVSTVNLGNGDKKVSVHCTGINNNSVVLASINRDDAFASQTISYKIEGDNVVSFFVVYQYTNFDDDFYSHTEITTDVPFSFVIYKSIP